MASASASMDVWGPWIWKALHLSSVRYKGLPADKRHMANLIHHLPYLLPCSKCVAHYISMVKDHPPHYATQPGLVKWFVDLHNRVNARIKKPVYALPQAVSLIGKWQARAHLKHVLHSIVTAFVPGKERQAAGLTRGFVHFLAGPEVALNLKDADFASKAALSKRLGQLGML